MNKHMEMLRQTSVYWQIGVAREMARDLVDKDFEYQGSMLQSFANDLLVNHGLHGTTRPILYAVYLAYREQTFVIGPELQKLLHDTDLSGVEVKDVTVPYDCIYLSFPNSGFLTKDGANVTGCYVDNGTLVKMTPRNVLHDPEIAPLIPNEIFLIFTSDRELNPDISETYHFQFSSSSLDQEQMTFESRGDIEEQIEKYFNQENNDRHDIEKWWNSSDDCQSMLRLVINSLLLIESSCCDVYQENPDRKRRLKLAKAIERSTGQKRARLQQQLSQSPDRHVTYIKPPEISPQSNTTGSKKRAHFVRGHWRKQVCGKKRSERKRKWIMPHIRGYGDLLERESYRIKEPTNES